MKLVSVIVPCYNHAPYLEERIESILGQDYPSFEVILIDDCSTDNTREILSRYEGREHIRAILFNPENSGNTFCQWRRGLSMAQGEYVWIAESDDAAAPALLSRLVNELDARGESAALAFAASEWVDREGKTIARPCTRTWMHDFRMGGKEFACRYLLGYNHICNASAVVMRRDAAMRVSDECMSYRASGDRQFWLEMAMQGDVCYVAEKLNRFRQHEQKVSGPAEKAGRNIVEDHRIYSAFAGRLPLGALRRRLICGYHFRAISAGHLSENGRTLALQAWTEEPEFGKFSYIIYLISRFLAKLGCRC